MYRVVGCRQCGGLWIVADRPETTTCPRCDTRHRFDALHAFAETEDRVSARQARAALLAERAGQTDAFEAVADDVFGEPDPAVSERPLLEGAGLDADAIAAAGERATAGPPRSPGRREIVMAALDALEHPTEAAIVDYATDRDVPAESAAALLERLVQAGEVTEHGGRYRRV